jgi:hypothetical protein
MGRKGWTVDTELTAYVTIEGIVHGVVWEDRDDGYSSHVVLLCAEQWASNSTMRTAAKPEPLTCIVCQAKG